MNTKDEPNMLRKCTQETVSYQAPESNLTFATVAEKYFEKKSQNFAGRNPEKQIQRLKHLLNEHCLPRLGNIPMEGLGAADIVQTLEPIWAEKPTTAERVRRTINGVCELAKSLGAPYQGTNPASWRGNLDRYLSKPNVSVIVRSPALSHEELPRFFNLLRLLDTIPARALEFMILTAASPRAVQSAQWEEVSLDEKLWAIPGWKIESRRSSQSQEIPLTKRAIEILTNLPRDAGESVFPGYRSNGTMRANLTVKKTHHAVLENGGPGFVDPESGRVATAYGMRRTFEDYATEKARVEDHVLTLALSKFDRSSAQSEFKRKQLIPERRKLMTDFEEYVLKFANQPKQ